MYLMFHRTATSVMISNVPKILQYQMTKFLNQKRFFHTFGTYKDSDQCTGVCGHFTQVVWADSYRVGCAAVECSMDETDQEAYGIFTGEANLLVCQYYRGGNYLSQYAWETGAPASNCPSTSLSSYQVQNEGLCAPKSICEEDRACNELGTARCTPAADNMSYTCQCKENFSGDKCEGKFL